MHRRNDTERATGNNDTECTLHALGVGTAHWILRLRLWLAQDDMENRKPVHVDGGKDKSGSSVRPFPEVGPAVIPHPALRATIFSGMLATASIILENSLRSATLPGEGIFAAPPAIPVGRSLAAATAPILSPYFLRSSVVLSAASGRRQFVTHCITQIACVSRPVAIFRSAYAASRRGQFVTHCGKQIAYVSRPVAIFRSAYEIRKMCINRMSS